LKAGVQTAISDDQQPDLAAILASGDTDGPIQAPPGGMSKKEKRLLKKQK